MRFPLSTLLALKRVRSASPRRQTSLRAEFTPCQYFYFLAEFTPCQYFFFLSAELTPCQSLEGVRYFITSNSNSNSCRITDTKVPAPNLAGTHAARLPATRRPHSSACSCLSMLRHPLSSAAAETARLEGRAASVFVLLYQQLRQYLYCCTSQPGDLAKRSSSSSVTAEAQSI